MQESFSETSHLWTLVWQTIYNTGCLALPAFASLFDTSSVLHVVQAGDRPGPPLVITADLSGWIMSCRFTEHIYIYIYLYISLYISLHLFQAFVLTAPLLRSVMTCRHWHVACDKDIWPQCGVSLSFLLLLLLLLYLKKIGIAGRVFHQQQQKKKKKRRRNWLLVEA